VVCWYAVRYLFVLWRVRFVSLLELVVPHVVLGEAEHDLVARLVHADREVTVPEKESVFGFGDALG